MKLKSLDSDAFNKWIHDFGSFKMVLDKQDNDLSRQVRFTGSYTDETLETSILKKELKLGQVFVDLGANLGFYSNLAASLVGKNGRVYAFEPFPHNFEMIKDSAKENSFDNLIVVNAAISNKIGKARLHLSPFYSSEHSLFDYHYSTGANSTVDVIDVDTTTIDEYMKNVVSYKIDFIKMDIEGSEGLAIDGMMQTIHENKKINLLTEFWPNAISKSGVKPKEYLEKLAWLGFELFHVDGLKHTVYPVTVEEIIDIMKQRTAQGFEKHKEVALGGWYTSILCRK